MYSTTFGLGLLVHLTKYLYYMYCVLCVGVMMELLANISLISLILSDLCITLHVTLHLCHISLTVKNSLLYGHLV